MTKSTSSFTGQFDGFDWDDGDWPKCAKHGVSKGEIEDVLSNRPSVLANLEHDPTELRFNAVGRNSVGRYIFIAFTIRLFGQSKRIRPISARYMHLKETEHYERRNEP